MANCGGCQDMFQKMVLPWAPTLAPYAPGVRMWKRVLWLNKSSCSCGTLGIPNLRKSRLTASSMNGTRDFTEPFSTTAHATLSEGSVGDGSTPLDDEDSEFGIASKAPTPR